MSEADPISVILVKSDSKGDRLLFRYPYVTTTRKEPSQQNRKRNPYAVCPVAEDIFQGPAPQTFNIDKGHLTGFTDEVLSTLFAVKQELCEAKFELKVNDVRFVGHPTLLQSSARKGSSESKQGNPSCVLINVVFALRAVANHSIVKCYYDLSKRIGVTLRHEEKRCGYVTDQMRQMILAHDEVSARQDDEGSKAEKETSPFEIILQQCSLACALRTAFDDLKSSGLVRIRINRWIQLTFCLPQKVHQFHKKDFMIEPETIDKCLQSLRPYHGMLLLIEPNQLMDSLSLDCSPALLRLLKLYSPLKSLQTLSADADLTLAQVFNLTGHLVYWGNAIVIYPLCESNVYVVSPDAPTHANSPLVEKFSEHFPGESLLQVMSEFSQPASLRMRLSPVSQPSQSTRLLHTVVWLLQHRLVLQLHTYVYFMPTDQGLSKTQVSSPGRSTTSMRESSRISTPDEIGSTLTRAASETDISSTISDEALPSITTIQTGTWEEEDTEGIIHEELLSDLPDNERVAILRTPAAANAEDLRLLMRLVTQGYLHGNHHLEEIMYFENLRRSQLLQLLDKFRDVLITCECEDPAISIFFLHSS